jgi:hypothetical protein
MDINDFLSTNKLDICFIMAHHDDETLIFGGLLLFMKNYIEKHNYIYKLLIITNISTENINIINSRKQINFNNVIKFLKFNNNLCLNFNNNLLLKYDIILNTIKIQHDEKKLDMTILKNKNKQMNEIFTVHQNKIKNRMKNINNIKIDTILDNIIKYKELNSLFDNIINKKKTIIEKYKNILINLRLNIKNENELFKAERIKHTLEIECINKNMIDYIKFKMIIQHNKELILIKKKIIEYDKKNGPFGIIFTHNIYGEYGNIQHKLVNYIVQMLKKNEWKDKIILTITNEINDDFDFFLKINKNDKQQLIKMYDFKNTIHGTDIWFNQCLEKYSFWADNEYEYYKIMK